MTRPATAALLLLAAAAGADEPPLRGAFERTLAVPAPGRVVVTLDRDVYERAREDLGDVRVLDERDRAVPYLLDRAAVEDAAQWQPRLLDQTFVRGESSAVTLDYGEPALKDELSLRLSGDNFRRRVKVEGQARRDGRWETVTDGAYVFAVPGPPAARYETVALPGNTFQFLRVTVYDGPDEDRPVAITGATSARRERRPPAEVTAPLALRAVEDARQKETQVLADLGARHQPVRGLVLDVGDREFFRGVEIEEREDPVAPGREPSWRWVGQASVYRYRDGAVQYEKVRLDLNTRARVLRLHIRNLDDRPLQLRGISAVQPVERLAFEAVEGHRYRLAYGNARMGPPHYDLARTVGDPSAWIAQAAAATLGPAGRLEEHGPLLPWTERHPAVVWALLTLLVAGLGLITWRTLRSDDGASMKTP